MYRYTDENFMNPSASRARSIAISLVIVNLCLAGVAQGHPEFDPVTVNRYWKLTLLSPSEARLAYTVMFGAGPALAARQAADKDGDGKIAAAEADALGKRLLAEVQKSLVLTVDGKPPAATWEAPVVGLMGDAVGAAPFSVDLIAHLPVPAGDVHEITLDDATDLPALGETEFRVEASPTTTLVASHRGRTGDELTDRIVFRGPKSTMLEDRSIGVRFKAAPLPPPASHAQPRSTAPWLLAVAVGAGLLVLVVVVLGLRRYRSMNG
jgi:hypothetical protein